VIGVQPITDTRASVLAMHMMVEGQNPEGVRFYEFADED